MLQTNTFLLSIEGVCTAHPTRVGVLFLPAFRKVQGFFFFSFIRAGPSGSNHQKNTCPRNPTPQKPPKRGGGCLRQAAFQPSVLLSRSRSSPVHVGAVRCTQPSRCGGHARTVDSRRTLPPPTMSKFDVPGHVPGRRTSGLGVLDRVLPVIIIITVVVVVVSVLSGLSVMWCMWFVVRELPAVSKLSLYC